MLGHASAAMTLDVYADLFDSDFTAVADKLSETVGKMWARRQNDALWQTQNRLYLRGRFYSLSALGEIRTHTGRVLNPFPLPVGIRGPADYGLPP
jgi:hypothetical protein